MDRGSRILLSGTLSVAAYLLTMYVLLQSPTVAVFSGSEGTTTTQVFTVTKNNWDISITYFRVLSPFWDLRIEVYSEGEKNMEVFSASVISYVSPGNQESAELSSHPSLPLGSYYLKVYSESVQWTIQITQWG